MKQFIIFTILLLGSVSCFTQTLNKIYITSTGPWALARAKLFRPNHGPINVTLPDNVWDLGYSSFQLNDEFSICALMKRAEYKKAKRYRYKTLVYPNGSLSFDFFNDSKKYFGKYDIFGLWTTWPRLGVDERNQWDLYRDLPGGLKKTKEISIQAQKQGTKFFISYNPWDCHRFTD